MGNTERYRGILGRMHRWTLLVALVTTTAAAAGASSSPDGAVIVDSGSTNTLGYKIQIWSNAKATVVTQNRLGTTQAAVKPFTVPSSVATRFFADLQAARKGHAKGVPCMKSASFGTTTRVTWHGWMSPDLDCPPGDALTAALVHDVGVIRKASGIDSMPLHRVGLPMRPMPFAPISAPPSPAPTST